MKLNKITVDEFTTPSPESVGLKTKLNDVWKTMKARSIRHVLVVNGGSEPVGIISERDITTFSQASDFDSLLAEDVMSKDLAISTINTPLYEVALKMSQDKIGSTLIFDSSDNSYGIFTATDALNALVEVLRGDLDNQ